MQHALVLEADLLIGGRYRLVSPLGSGSTASVWHALDTQLERPVAVKILRADGVDSELRSRAEREARVLAGLNHPNIVRVLDSGEDDGHPYMVMELLDGEPLNRTIARREPLAVDDAVRLVADVADGLGAAHARGVIHRDVKPGNIVRHGDVPILVDFGIARNIDATTLTQGLVVGTAAYLAPEQAQGLALQPSADVYALGCVLYELLTGRAPFQGDSSIAVAVMHVQDAPVPPSDLVDLPAAIDAVVLRCLAKDPDLRPTDGVALAGALRGALAHEDSDADATVSIAPMPPVGGTTTMPPVPAAAEAAPAPRARAPFRPDWRIAAVAVAVVVIGIALLTRGGADDLGVRSVPDVTNASVTDATTYLEGAGLSVDIDNVPSDQPAGTVIASDPAAGQPISGDGTVQLSVSSGPPATTAPTLEDQIDDKPGRRGKRDD